MTDDFSDTLVRVHCRTGSLEISPIGFAIACHVHCRTGSLEISLGTGEAWPEVHCRTGSLESTDDNEIS